MIILGSIESVLLVSLTLAVKSLLGRRNSFMVGQEPFSVQQRGEPLPFLLDKLHPFIRLFIW